MIVKKGPEDPLKLNEYNKLKQTSANNVLAIEINIMLGININSSSSADGREGTNLDTPSEFTQTKKVILQFKIS